MRWITLLVLVLALVTAYAAGCVAAGEPRLVHVPGPIDVAGTVWLRCWVKVHENFFTPHERNLFEESVGLNFRDLAGAHEVWVNGVPLGAAGTFPPDFEPAPRQLFRYKVPVGTLRPSQWNEIAVRLYQPQVPAGFLGDAPFIMNYFWECELAGDWELLVDGQTPTMGVMADRPGQAVFERFRESQRVLGRAEQVTGPRRPPHESAAAIQAAEGLKVELLLHEPRVTQPFYFSFDARGRLWVSQSRQYPYPAGLTMVSRDRYYRSHYDKLPPPPPHHDRGEDLVSIHEDTDRDGIYDRHTVFLEGLNMANAVLRGRGGVWVMHTPYLLFYPDADFDDVADGPPEVHLAGFGFEDTHAIANGLAWGPDGWLYGAQGSTVSCRVVRPGLDDEPGVYFEGCMVWRYHPESRAFEIFCEGGGNTYGLEFDAAGRLYSGHNGGDTRGWHYVQGGFYRMQGVDPGKFGPPRNPYAFGELPMMSADTAIVRFTHFGAFAEGTAMPAELRGWLLALDPLHNEIIAAERLVQGATFGTSDRSVAVKSRDEAFRPVYTANAPDGSLLVADMYEYYIAHGQHYQNQIDTSTGRIYRISAVDARLETDINLDAKSTAQLVAFLSHPNKWHRYTAVRLLGERSDPHSFSELRQWVRAGHGHGALHALWALHQSGGLDHETRLAALQHRDAAVRAWCARLMGDSYGIHRNLGLPPRGMPEHKGLLPADLFQALLQQAASEPDAEARAQYASTARRLDADQALPLVVALLHRGEDRNDAYIPVLCWWVFEAHLPAAADQVLELLDADPGLWDQPLIVEQIIPRLARRLTVDGKRQELVQVARLLRMAPGETQAAQVLHGFEQAYRGRAMTALPEELVSALAHAGGGSLAIRLRQRDPPAVAEALDLIRDDRADLTERLQYVRSFGELTHDDAVTVLLTVARDELQPAALRKAALAALAAYPQDHIASDVLNALEHMPADVRPAALTMLASRPTWALQLMERLQAGTLNHQLVPADIAHHLCSHRDPGVRSAAMSLFQVNRTGHHNSDTELSRIQTVLSERPGDPYRGEALYLDRCGNCHRLFFKGGDVGPDLTRYQRDNLSTMLHSIVNPSAEIREGYQFIRVVTARGRIISGFEVDRDHQVLVLRGLDGQNVTVAVADIEEMEPVGRSLMPDGLLADLDPQQLRDLFAYLRISQPITP